MTSCPRLHATAATHDRCRQALATATRQLAGELHKPGVEAQAAEDEDRALALYMQALKLDFSRSAARTGHIDHTCRSELIAPLEATMSAFGQKRTGDTPH